MLRELSDKILSPHENSGQWTQLLEIVHKDAMKFTRCKQVFVVTEIFTGKN